MVTKFEDEFRFHVRTQSDYLGQIDEHLFDNQYYVNFMQHQRG
jgi:hypothetical protein